VREASAFLLALALKYIRFAQTNKHDTPPLCVPATRISGSNIGFGKQGRSEIGLSTRDKYLALANLYRLFIPPRSQFAGF